MSRPVIAATLAALVAGAFATPVFAQVTIGPRPLHLVDRMADGPLKEKLLACAGMPMERKLFSIGHRGAPLMFPEHTAEGNVATARMCAGVLECDVTFMKDKELVCRHAQNDLHTTTNILVADLAATCVRPFQPATTDAPASAECRTFEITLAEFRTLTPKMDAADPAGTTPEAFLGGTADWRTELHTVSSPALMTHAESIELFRSLDARFTPELKAPSVEMPFDGFSQEDYAQKLVDEFKTAGVPPEDVWLQSFQLEDVLYWVREEPDFGKQADYLIDDYEIEGWDHMIPETWEPSMEALAEMGVNIVAPPLWVLVTLDEQGRIVPSTYAKAAKAAGLDIVTWTLERSGPLHSGGGWYFQSITDAVTDEGAAFEVLHVLAQDVGVLGVFSDWPATVTYYANCMGLD